MTPEEHEKLHAAGIAHSHDNIESEHTHADGTTHTHTHADGTTHTHTHADGTTHTHTHADGTTHTHTHGHGHHGHVHSDAEKKQVINRLSRAIGHLESVKRMVERDEDCSDVLIQLAAVRGAINNTGKIVLKNHISHCLVEAVEENDTEMIEMLNDAIDKFVK